MIILLLLLIVIFIGFLELLHLIRPNSPLKLKAKDLIIRKDPLRTNISVWLEIYNPHKKIEVMVPSFTVTTKLLGDKYTKKIKTSTLVTPHHKDEENREDNYWNAYIVKSRDSTNVHVSITIESKEINTINTHLESIWLEINWSNYGPFGQINRFDGLVIPNRIKASNHQNINWINSENGSELLPIKTHILGKLDNPYEILIEYASSIVKPGDILTIGETPLAVMQGRYIIPKNIKISFIARLLCIPFHPTSSLATACGMQSLIDLEGPSKVLISWVISAFLKTFGIKGIFYRLAGEQARLIDDITGTTPPYDQTIVLGPVNIDKFCNISAKRLGIDIAIVDVNDLGRVKVLSCNKNCNKKLVYQSLISNPAGNANQHTPLVLIRPS